MRHILAFICLAIFSFVSTQSAFQTSEAPDLNEYCDIRCQVHGRGTISGRPGKAGPRGPVGMRGPPGEKGMNGIQGPPGPQGEKRMNGIQGPPGPRGKKGMNGIQGPPGRHGEKGMNGTQGQPGPQGEKGMTGISGRPGKAGPHGPVGMRGPPGEKGMNGIQGPPGPQEEDGSQGPQGFRGTKGARGYTGLPGLQGFPGLDGMNGLPGLRGPPGPGVDKTMLREMVKSIIIEVLPSLTPHCADGFLYQGLCYWVVAQRMDFEEAKVICRKKNGVPAYPVSLEHYNTMVRYIQGEIRTDKFTFIWTGLYRDVSTGETRLSDGSIAPYTSMWFSHRSTPNTQVVMAVDGSSSSRLKGKPSTFHANGVICQTSTNP